MNQSHYGSTALLTKALRAGAEAFLAVLDAGDTPPAPPVMVERRGDGELIEYDPLTDPVPLPQDPAPYAPKAQRQMAWVTYLGAIARINASQGRGANTDEVRKYALKAGYPDARAVNGWADREGSEDRAVRNIDGARYLKADSLPWIHEMAAEIGIELKGDFTPLPIPQQ